MNCITPDEIRTIEINSEYLGVPRAKLMENAGKQVFLAMEWRFDLREKVVAVYCGTGNNGGDGFVAAKYFANAGADVSVILIGESVKTPEAKEKFEAIKNLVCKTPPKNPDIIIDAILGTGIKGPLKGPVRSVVREINESNAFKLSIDLPTGLDPNTGKGDAVNADLVVTFHRMKRGLENFETEVTYIGVPKGIETRIGPGDLIVNLKRSKESHKGENGKVLVVGGSDMFHGAPILCGLGALYSGADLVFLCVPEGNFDVTRAATPDFIVRQYDGDYLCTKSVKTILDLSEQCDVLVIGPGLGDREDTRDAVIEILKGVKIPVVIDADAIKAVSDQRELLKSIDAVITPHTREFTVLTKGRFAEDPETMIDEVSRYARRLSSVILLKSPEDIIASPEEVKVNTTGDPGMTVGGTGDVLSGIVASFISQGMSPSKGACCAAFVNGAAGERLSEQKGHAYTASDVAMEIPHTIKMILEIWR